LGSPVFLLFLLLLSSPTVTQDAEEFEVNLPPVSLFPADGKIPPPLKDRYVFLDKEVGELLVLYPESLANPDSKERSGSRIESSWRSRSGRGYLLVRPGILRGFSDTGMKLAITRALSTPLPGCCCLCRLWKGWRSPAPLQSGGLLLGKSNPSMKQTLLPPKLRPGAICTATESKGKL